jgi:hypothetical protein
VRLASIRSRRGPGESVTLLSAKGLAVNRTTSFLTFRSVAASAKAIGREEARRCLRVMDESIM